MKTEITENVVKKTEKRRIRRRNRLARSWPVRQKKARVRRVRREGRKLAPAAELRLLAWRQDAAAVELARDLRHALGEAALPP